VKSVRCATSNQFWVDRNTKWKWKFTERRGRVVNTPGSYSGASRFNLRPETGYIDWDFSWFFSVPPGECRDNPSKLGHDRFLLNHFELIIYLLPFHSTQCSPSYWKASCNKIQNYRHEKIECRCLYRCVLKVTDYPAWVSERLLLQLSEKENILFRPTFIIRSW
jgi:hypothetical protein